MSEDFLENIDSPNSSAYEKVELRDGIPLDYVNEKLGLNLKIIHRTYKFVTEYLSDDLKLKESIDDSFSPKQDGLVDPLMHAFRYGVTSFLALHNMLGIASNQDIFEKLLNFSDDDFNLWIERIECEGSING